MFPSVNFGLDKLGDSRKDGILIRGLKATTLKGEGYINWKDTTAHGGQTDPCGQLMPISGF